MELNQGVSHFQTNLLVSFCLSRLRTSIWDTTNNGQSIVICGSQGQTSLPCLNGVSKSGTAKCHGSNPML